MHLGTDVWTHAGTAVHAPLAGRVRLVHDNDQPLDYGPMVVLEHATDDGTPFYSASTATWPPATLEPRRRRSAGGGGRGHRVDRRSAAQRRLGTARPRAGDPRPARPRRRLPGRRPAVAERDVARPVAGPGAAARPAGIACRATAPGDRGDLRRPAADCSAPISACPTRDPCGSCAGSGPTSTTTWGAPTSTRSTTSRTSVTRTRTWSPPGTRQMARPQHEHALPARRRSCATPSGSPRPCPIRCRCASSSTRAARRTTSRCDSSGRTPGPRTWCASTTATTVTRRRSSTSSPYKHAGPGGRGAPSWVHVAAMPDPYRGPHRGYGPEVGRAYAADVARCVAEAGDEPVAGMIVESMIGCGGQVVLPDGYLAESASIIRAAGGLVIADEVQVGFGRVGPAFWGFATQGLVPDVVTVGKPAGDGHPLAAVITTPEIAASFANGMEYFNTFGGNPVSAAIGLAVLDVIEQERLPENAARLGALILDGVARARRPARPDRRRPRARALPRDRARARPRDARAGRHRGGPRHRADARARRPREHRRSVPQRAQGQAAARVGRRRRRTGCSPRSTGCCPSRCSPGCDASRSRGEPAARSTQ